MTEDNEKKSSNADDEWESRVLCSDESCIGVIGPDGRCKECGLPYEGELPVVKGGGFPADTAETEDAAADAEDETDGHDEDDSEPAAPDDEWESRVLCSDESCIGVIGPDGRCKECGKPYEG